MFEEVSTCEPVSSLSSHVCTGVPYNHMLTHCVKMCLPVPLDNSHHPLLDEMSNIFFLSLWVFISLCPSPDRPSTWTQTLAACREKGKAPNWQLNRKSAFCPAPFSAQRLLIRLALTTSLKSAPWTELPLVLGWGRGAPRNSDSVREGPQGLCSGPQSFCRNSPRASALGTQPQVTSP